MKPLESNDDVPADLRAELLSDSIREAAEVAGIGVVVTLVDVDPPVNLYMNGAMGRILGIPAEQLLLRNSWSTLAPEELGRLRAMQQRRLRGEPGPARFETAMLNRNGERVPVEIAMHRLMLAGRPCNVSLVVDLSERKRAEVALRKSEARFRLLVQSAPDGVTVIQGGRFVFVNPAAASMLGFSDPADVLGRTVQSMLVADDAERARERIECLLREGALPGPTEYRVIDSKGNQRSVEILSVRTEYQGRPAVLGFARDITDRKAVEQQLQLADRLAAVGLLSAGVAHEINNPLSYVLMNLEYLTQELPRVRECPELLDGLLQRVRDAYHGAERVASIVRSLKSFVRPNGVVGPVNIVDVIESALKMVSNELRHVAHVVRDFELGVPRVVGDPTRLEQVLLNLLINAGHALASEDCERSEVRIVLRSLREQNRVRIEVVDTGPGIDGQELDSIFEPFFTTKPHGVGTGLGLYICRNIVESLGGRLDAASEKGRGASFVVELPAHVDSATNERLDETAPASSRVCSRGRLLIVDDEPGVAKTLSLLVQDDYDVDIADGVDRALAYIDVDPSYDAILCDLMMPGLTGMDLLEIISARVPALKSRIVFMTGGALGERAERFVATLEEELLYKPFDLEQLLKALERVRIRGTGS